MAEDNVDDDASQFPSSRLKRGQVAASAGIKMGSNYARYLARRSVGGDSKGQAKQQLNRRNAQDLFKQLTKLRGTALKMAQGMSLETGFLPEEFAATLSQAQYQVPPMNSALVRKIIKANLGSYPEDIFTSFDLKAVAAASLGQVHKATLEDGTTVAVKVQYPNVRESIDADLAMIKGIANRIMGAGVVDAYVDEMGARLREEVDYMLEGKNIEFFAGLYEGNKFVTPRWIPELTNTGVLTMTFVDGLHLDAYMATNPNQNQRNHFAQQLFDFAHTQIVSPHLAVHADAHPGNFLFRDDGKIGILDFGCVKRFPEKFRDDLLRLFVARLQNDHELTMAMYRELEFLTDSQTEEQQAFLMDVLKKTTDILVAPYQADTFDFSDGTILESFRKLIPTLTGKDAFKNRGPVGSPHFVFVNRLVVGFFSMLTGLSAEVNVVDARRMLLDAANLSAT